MSVILADAIALPFGNEQFDGAALSGTLGSLSKPEDFLKELHRVILPTASGGEYHFFSSIRIPSGN